ncbi:MAG: HAD family hydrolase [Myxococcota bacterium]|nr:HAD family hydrolase [Myxococcota bacterium]
MSFSSVIFDVDGTLVDSVDLHARAWQEAFDHFGKHVAFDAVRAQIGKGGDQLVPHFLSPRELSAIGDKLEKFRGEIFKRNYMPQVRAFPRTRELFERLVGDDVKVALASSAKPHELKHYIEVARIGDLIDAKTAAADVEKTKPDPEVVRVALERLGKPAPAKVRMVGDTPWDVEAAHAAGVACISVLCGGFPEADLKRAGSDGIFEGPADLIESYQRFRATPPLST